MTQRRFVNFGSDASASKVKDMNAALAAPQVLRAPDPFLLVSIPETLVVQPHAIIFESGIILDETEQLSFTVPTTFGSADYTLAYQHVDEDIIGGTAATIELQGGLFSTVDNGVILGWVRYPGGAVPLDGSMVFPNRVGQLRPSSREVAGTGALVVQSPDVTQAAPAALLAQTIPAVSPYQLSLGAVHVSRLLAVAEQHVRVYDHTAGVQLTRITAGTPATGQFILDSSTGTMSFAALDASHVVDVSDVTYGADGLLASNTSVTAAGIVDTVYSFGVSERPLRAVTAEYIPLTTGYALSVVEALDAVGESITTKQAVTGPTTADGTAGRLVCRLLDGVRNGTAGQFVTVRIRQTVPVSGSGLLLRVRATDYDLPF